jgi:hypothetical protein
MNKQMQEKKNKGKAKYLSVLRYFYSGPVINKKQVRTYIA